MHPCTPPALIVFPMVLVVHAAGQALHVHVTDWLLLAFILVTASLLTAAVGLLLGTVMDPRKMQMLFAVVTPGTAHMPLWAILTVLVGGTVVFGYLGTRTFTRRVLN